jgi:hypothetical protein
MDFVRDYFKPNPQVKLALYMKASGALIFVFGIIEVR